MQVRIFSSVVCRTMMFIATSATFSLCGGFASAQSGAGYYTNPETGIVYQQVKRTVERPVTETRVESRQQTVYRPQTVTETKPRVRTVYTPVIEYKWEPRVHGRWNPFRSPTVAYHHVPRTHWEQRNDVVQQTTTRTEWVAETRNIDVPQRIVRMEREEKIDYEPVGHVAPQQASPPGASEALASRLRPLAPNERIATSFSAPRIASSTVGRMTSDPPRRTAGQGGMRTTTLTPSNQVVHGQPLPPSSTGVANLPLPMFR